MWLIPLDTSPCYLLWLHYWLHYAHLSHFKIWISGWALKYCPRTKGHVVALGCHFATLCQELDFWSNFFFIINFWKEKANTFNHSSSKKSKNRATYMAQICYYDPQSAGINVQSPQSATTPRILTLPTKYLKWTLISHFSLRPHFSN